MSTLLAWYTPTPIRLRALASPLLVLHRHLAYPGSRSAPTTTGEPTIGAAGVAASQPTTTDGTCGSQFGESVCGDWPNGACCSEYGWCGNSTAHCGDGCQSGPCLNPPSKPAPSAKSAPANPNPGYFNQTGQSGVPVMHAALEANDLCVFLDKVENYTQVHLPDGQLAYSTEYNPTTGTYVPLGYKTNAFCAGGAFLPNGALISVGGNAPLTWLDPTVGDGFNAIRYLTRTPNGSMDGQFWVENTNKLNSDRWYPSAQVLPDGRVFVCSGSLNGLDPAVNTNNNPTYELLDAQGRSISSSISMELLVKNQPYYMYPFLALLPNGNLFVFVAKSSQVFDLSANKVVRELPDLPGLYRTYPNTGAGQLLPLSSKNNYQPSFIVCGGGAYQDITSPTDPSCGRINPLASNPQWEMDSMPYGRVMGEFQLLPNGMMLLLNGAGQGAQGFGLATNPTTQALLYDPDAPLGKRWHTLGTSPIHRLYHSVCLLLSDGRVLIAGSNPNEMPVLTPNAEYPFPTEFRVEIYTPPYGDLSKRPTDVTVSAGTLRANGMSFTVTFNLVQEPKTLLVALMTPGFVTHSLHMGERAIFLDWTRAPGTLPAVSLNVRMPPNSSIVPPGPARVYVSADGVPGDAAAYVLVA
ncbi:glyoxal oxidase [Rhizodiscina lignyota]|uniref:Glyoxal oxidase n=1 Tax=Rhizodiscina lignyota TaxID=1504668 RepID=A0A9P4MEX5_9PEZI|nr:glyoxal oxidase [Rhizodiscina lignyota]